MTEPMHTSALSDEELMSVAYDEADLTPEQREHLAHCSICQEQLAMYTNINTRLLAKLYRSICPSAVNLNYYCLGMVSDEERMHIASHLLDCPACTDEVAEIRRTQASVDLYPSVTWSPMAALRRIFATLVVQEAQVVTRASMPGSGWPRQYRAESIDLSLHLSRASNGEMLLLGIITSNFAEESVDAFEGQRVDLYVAPGPLTEAGDDSAPLYTTDIDDVGNIVLEDIQAGNYIMILRLFDREVVIEGLNIENK